MLYEVITFLTVTAIMLMLTIDESMNRVFRVQRPRALGQKLLMYWGVLTLGPVLIGMSLSLTTFVVGASLGWMRMGTLAQDVLRLVPRITSYNVCYTKLLRRREQRNWG